jgi:predicted small integral membrane protein
VPLPLSLIWNQSRLRDGVEAHVSGLGTHSSPYVSVDKHLLSRETKFPEAVQSFRVVSVAELVEGTAYLGQMSFKAISCAK